MKPFTYFLVAAVAATALTLLCIGTSAPLAAQTPAPAPSPAAAASPAPPPAADAKDYLVKVGKHYMWKSQLTVMHPELARTAQPLSKTAGSDYLVQVGKHPSLPQRFGA